MRNYPSNTCEWLYRLISFNTVSRHSNLALIEYIEDFCKQLNLSPVLTFNECHSKANLFVTIPAGKQSEILTGGIVLSGHTDVVPTEGQNWLTDPFNAVTTDSKIYGRGACDMKGFIACALAALPKAVELSQNGSLSKPLHLALSFDEEVGCLGAPILLSDVTQRRVNPEYCVVGEPSMMEMVVAHKGISVFTCKVYGKSMHSSLTPQGVNAIVYAAKLINFIDSLASDLKEHGINDNQYDVPYSTLSVGTIEGGTATNIVPNYCEFTFDYRNLPVMTTQTILEPINKKIAELNTQMQQIDSHSKIVIDQLEDVPGLTDTDNQNLQALVAKFIQSSDARKVAYATEGGQFSKFGIPTVICGPGSIEQAHKANEYVSLEQLSRCDVFIDKLIDSISK